MDDEARGNSDSMMMISHSLYTNGRDYLSFVPKDKSNAFNGGTWIIGDKAGIDRGFVHIKTDYISTVPPFDNDNMVNEQSVVPQKQWKWLNDQNEWTNDYDVRFICVDQGDKTSQGYQKNEANSASDDVTNHVESYYLVEYVQNYFY